LHVPLLISFPSRVPAGRTVREPVTLRDLPATVVDLLQLEGGPRFPGASLARYWDSVREAGNAVIDPPLSEVRGKPWKPKWFPVHKGDMQSLVDDRYHYIRNGDGREELYDFENDPWEKRDLAGSEVGSRVLTRFRTWLQTFLARSE
jgi:arylsulfatase A-like enzyme